jgi:hypothetical protein
MKKRDEEMRRITRMDYKKCGKSWWVRICEKGSVVSHMVFADSKFGGKRKALIEAKRWRDKTEVEMFGEIQPYTYGKQFRDMIQVNNTSGKTGVFYGAGYTDRGKYCYPFWAATWVDRDGSKRVKRFYPHHYPSGMLAMEAAINFRVDKEKKMVAMRRRK